MFWTYSEPSPTLTAELQRRLGVSATLAGLLVRAGHGNAEEAERFLHPRLAHLEDPLKVGKIDAAVARVLEAIAGRQDVVVLGDYDVDGVTSTALLVSVLRLFGLQPRYYVPRRMEEGYGLSRAAIDRACSSRKPDLFIALDCGTNATPEIAYLRSLGCDVIVIDHHRSKESLPGDCILVNPHVHDPETAPWRNFCTVGLVFKLAHGLVKRLRENGNQIALGVRLKDYLDLVALGTIADLVPLTEENRILARFGLKKIETSRRQGIVALLDASGVQQGQAVMPVDVSYRMGPRINACGRLSDASIPVDLLLSENLDECRKTARLLNDLNRERQEIERQVYAEAEHRASANFANRSAIVIFGTDWHPGVVGIVAGKLSRQFNRPCIVLGREGATAKGSGRSVTGLNLVELLQSCNPMLSAWGGHPMAVGVSLPSENVEAFTSAFEQAVLAKLQDGTPSEAVLEIAQRLRLSDFDEKLLHEMELLHPFGEGNPEPIFSLHDVVLYQVPEVFGDKNFRLSLPLPNGRYLGAVAWRKADRLPPIRTPIELAVKLSWNWWNGRRSAQAEIIDWRLA